MLDRLRSVLIRPALALGVSSFLIGMSPAIAQPANTPVGTPPPSAPAPTSPTADTPATAESPPRVPPKLEGITPLAHVEVSGKGPVPMVLIPHWTMEWTTWQGFMQRNQDRYTMYAVTLPGFGGSDAPPLPMGALPSDGLWLDNAAAAVVDLIKTRNIDKPVVVGHSLGGNVALRIALLAPESIRSVVSIDGMPAVPMSAPREPPVSKEIRGRMVNERLRMQHEAVTDEGWLPLVRKRAMEWVRDPALGSRIADAAARVPKSVASNYLCEMMATDMSSDLAGMRVPALLIAPIPEVSPAPGLTLEDIRQNWRNTLTSAMNCQLVFFEACKALVVFDAPDATDRAVAQFVAGQPVQGKPAAAAR